MNKIIVEYLFKAIFKCYTYPNLHYFTYFPTFRLIIPLKIRLVQNFNYLCVDKYALTDKVNNFSMTYKHLDSYRNMKVLVKYVMNTAPPLRVVAVEALHHHITALSVGIHRVLSVTPYFFH